MPAHAMFHNDTDEYVIGYGRQRNSRERVRWPPAHRCTATTKAGVRCKRFAVRGAELCPHHVPDKSEQYRAELEREVNQMRIVKSAADILREAQRSREEAVAYLADKSLPAAEVLYELAANEELSPQIRGRAAADILRFNGFGTSDSPVNIQVNVNNVHRSDAAEIVAARIERLAAAAGTDVIPGELEAPS